VKIIKMQGSFGAIVDGIDVAEPLDDATMLSLAAALYENRILILDHQELSPAQCAAFGRQWGEPISFFAPDNRDQQFPELIKITNSPSIPEVSRDGAMHWHSDSSYEAIPAAVTMLYAVEAPLTGNDTQFADTVAAYLALTCEFKERIESLVVIHDPRGGKVHLPGEVRGRGATAERPIVNHPLVTTHPVTKAKALYGFSGTAAGIVGMDEAQAIDLLLELKQHVLQPQFMQRAAARQGQILLWDNYSVIHCATPTRYSAADGERRFLYRISTNTLPGVCA
jgi:taurine dioxygenase